MSASTTVRPKSEKTVSQWTGPVKASTKILGGTVGGIDASGWAVPMTAATGIKVIGVAKKTADNSNGSNGAINVTFEFSRPIRVFLFENDAGTPLTKADVWGPCYGIDNQSMSGDDSGHSVGGTVYEVTTEGVWVFFDP